MLRYGKKKLRIVELDGGERIRAISAAKRAKKRMYRHCWARCEDAKKGEERDKSVQKISQCVG